MQATTEPADYSTREPGAITIHALKENKRPIGFAAWTTQDERKPKRQPKRKPAKKT